jgi:hypothetical protein
MGEAQDRYWDLNECRWVEVEPPVTVEVPEQPTGVETSQGADVRSG